MSRKDTRLIEVRGPTAEELAEGHIGAGAEIVFIRAQGEARFPIYAATGEHGHQQWGQGTPILGDNVEAVTRWAEGMAEVYAMVYDEDEIEDADEADEDEAERRKAELIEEGYTVEEPDQGTFRFRDPVGDLDDDNYGSEPWAWEGAWEDYVKYRK